ncbi:MAG: hypothetical protein OXF27_07500 [Acidobacteria bacterium]|nr:hypothetical protein [Acidobacteriota bacterium]
MNRRIHGAPAQALSDALAALSELAFWVVWTADPDLSPEPPVSARAMRDAARSLRKAAQLLEEAADRAEPPSGPGGGDRRDPATGGAVPPSRPGEPEAGFGEGGRGPVGEGRTP